jgi:hypothetical protein
MDIEILDLVFLASGLGGAAKSLINNLIDVEGLTVSDHCVRGGDISD